MLHIRGPLPQELKIIRRRFPQLLDTQHPAEIFIADRSDMQGTMAGWLALKFIMDNQGRKKAMTLIHVNQQLRRQGVGSSLLEKSIEVAKNAGAHLVTHMRPILGGSSSEKFLQSKGFERTLQYTTYELKTEKVLEVVRPIYDKLLARKKFSAENNLYSVENIAFKSELNDCIARNLGQLPNLIEERLQSNLDSFSQAVSPVVVDKGRILGLILATVNDNHATIDATAVEQDYRNSWVNVALKYRLARNLKELGIQTVHLGTHAKLHPDSYRLVKRTDAQILLKQRHYELHL